MDNFEEEVKYFIDLVCKDIKTVMTGKPKNISKKEMIFFNFNIRLDGQEIVVYNQEKDFIYDIPVKKIQDFEFKYVDKDFALNIIEILTKYINNKISFKKFLHLFSVENQI